MAQELMAKSPIPLPLQYVMLCLGLAISILSAIFMLRAANWARLLYIGWSGIEFLVLLLTSPVKPMLIPGILMYNEIYLELLGVCRLNGFSIFINRSFRGAVNQK